MGTRFAESGRVRATSAATRARDSCRTSASAVCSPTGWRFSATPAGNSSPVAALLDSDLSSVLRYNSVVSQPTEGTAASAFLSLAVNIVDGDADDPLGLTVVTSDDHLFATVDHPLGWFVVYILFDSLAPSARSGQGFRSLSSPR